MFYGFNKIVVDLVDFADLHLEPVLFQVTVQQGRTNGVVAETPWGDVGMSKCCIKR